MRAVAVHPQAVVVTSRLWQTTATALRSGEEALLVDSPYFPDELELLPELLRQAGFEVDGLVATHGDFDHLLGRLALPALALGVAETTGERLRAEPGAPQRELRDQDASLYVRRGAPLTLGAVQELPVPGRLELGDAELELHPTVGHSPDGLALMARWAGVLVVGDYLSDVEIPWIQAGGSLQGYRETLARLAPLVEAAEVVVPGHGALQDREGALRRLDEDVDYLDALERGEPRPRLPEGRSSTRQRDIHRENLARVHGG
jgi:glyoxylase-like metal-dependent hydrolase (beta-lactamase superfamily II)